VQPRLIFLIAILGAGCLPPPDNAGELLPGSSGSADGETTDQATTLAGTGSSTSDAESGTGSGTVSDAGSTTAAELDDPCLEFSPEACPAECTLTPTYRQAKGVCDVHVSDAVYLCMSAGGPLDEVPTTFYAEIDGETRYVIHYQPCVMGPDATPALFSECSGAAGEPELCSCLCGSEGCPADAELLALEACDLPSPCGELLVNDTDMASDYDLCVLAALRDRIPGAYASHRVGLFGDASHVFLFGGEDAQLVHAYGSDFCTSAVSAWDPTRTCTLQSPAWFDACMTDTALQPDCLFGESWFESCTEQPAACG